MQYAKDSCVKSPCLAKKIDKFQRSITLEDGTEIAIDQLYEIEGEVFDRTGDSM